MVAEQPVFPLGSFLFPRIFQAFRVAVGPSKLAVAFAAVAILGVAGWIMDFSRTVIVATDYNPVAPRAAAATLPAGRSVDELDIYVQPGAGFDNFIESRKSFAGPEGTTRTGVFHTLWHFGAREFHNAMYALLTGNLAGVAQSVGNGIRALAWAFRWHTIYSVVFFAIAVVVLALAGGALSRMAALQFAKAERPTLTEAVRFALRRPVSLLGGLLGPVVLAVVFGIPIMFLGLVGNIPVLGELLTGLLLLPALLTACAATILLVGAAPGLGLMSPAVAYEDADGFDAISHSLSYVYAKPWHIAFYSIVAVIYGAICYVFVRFFAFLLLWTTYRFLAVGFLGQNAKLHAIWPEPTFASLLGPAAALPDTWSLWLAALLVRLGVLVVIGLLAAFVVSFYFSANTIIYALMRHVVDGTPLEEVYTRPAEAAAAVPSGTTAAGTGSAPALEMNGGAPQAAKTSE